MQAKPSAHAGPGTRIVEMLEPAAHWAGAWMIFLLEDGAAAVCLAGGLTAAAVTLAISATAHARITAPVRWSGSFLPRLIYFDEQAAVAVAVVVALIVAAKARSVQAVASAVGAAAVSAGLGAPASYLTAQASRRARTAHDSPTQQVALLFPAGAVLPALTPEERSGCVLAARPRPVVRRW